MSQIAPGLLGEKEKMNIRNGSKHAQQDKSTSDPVTSPIINPNEITSAWISQADWDRLQFRLMEMAHSIKENEACIRQLKSEQTAQSTRLDRLERGLHGLLDRIECVEDRQGE